MKHFLRDIALEAGCICLDYRSRHAELTVRAKTDTKKDLVTEADQAVESFLTDAISRRYPEHAILGEEQGSRPGNEYRWVIDPIDGTTSFVHKQHYFAVSIALEHRGQTLLAAVNAPALGELFEAERGRGATLNGAAIGVSGCRHLGEAVLGTGFACIRAGLAANNLPYFNALVPRIRGIRRCGSAALDLCSVACGRLDGYWELNLQLYDIAAGVFILTEAGGRVSDLAGTARGIPHQVLATNSLLHNELVSLLRTVQPH